MPRALELKGPSAVKLMIIINSEQALVLQPAGSGRMPGSPTVRFEKQDPEQPRTGAGWKGGVSGMGGAVCPGGR